MGFDIKYSFIQQTVKSIYYVSGRQYTHTHTHTHTHSISDNDKYYRKEKNRVFREILARDRTAS